MNHIKLTKTNIILTVLFFISIIMLPIEFYWGSTAMEIMAMDKFYNLLSGILLWIFFVAQLVTVITGFLRCYDLTAFFSIISACSFFFALFSKVIDDGLDNIEVAAILYFAIAFINVFISIKQRKAWKDKN